MKKSFRLLALVLSIVLLTQAAFVSANAFDIASMSPEEWESYYLSLKDDNTLPTLCVGANETQLNITWHADADLAQAIVRMADNPEMENAVVFQGETVASANDEQLVCRVVMTGIEEYSTYYYQWFAGADWSEVCKYESKGFDSYKMLIVGDIQIGNQSDSYEEQARVGYAWQNLLDEALSQHPDISFLLSPGDNTSTGKMDSEWQTLLMPKSLRSLPMALAIGNHDKKGFTYNYFTYMPNEYYGRFFSGLNRDFWFRYGDALFLVFDATSGSAYDHKAMAQEAVSLNPDAKWRIGVMHQALNGAGMSAYDPETAILLNAVFQPIFNMYDLDFVLTGHSHNLGRSHFIERGLVVGQANNGNSYTDPRGIIYLNASAVCNQGGSPKHPWLDFALEEGDIITYSTIEFDANSMDIKTFRGDNSELLDSLKIEKTQGFNDDYPLKTIDNLLYKIVELFGIVYLLIDKMVVASRGGSF